MAEKAWSGVFQEATDRRVEKFTESVSFDRRLYAHDVVASIAHAQMLAKVGLLSDDECRQIEQALCDIRREIEQGRFEFKIELEDIHMHIERALVDRLGDVGRKLHTGRSRNDQVSTDLRLWVRDAIDRIDERLAALQARLRRTCRARRRLHPARLHPSAPGAAGAGRPLLAGLLRKVRARSGPAGRLPPARQRAAAGRGGRGGHQLADRSPGRRPAAGLRRRGGQQPRRVERSRLRRRVRLFAVDGRRTPQHLGRRVDPLVDRRVRLSAVCRRRFAPARRSCRRKSTPTCWN